MYHWIEHLVERREEPLVHRLSLQPLPEALGEGVVVTRPDAAHAPADPETVADLGERARGVLDPLSAWKITPAALPPRVATAIFNASTTSSVRMWVAIDLHVCDVGAPLFVELPSTEDAVHQSGAGGVSRSGTVVRLRRRRWRPWTPLTRISRSTRLRLTVCPKPRGSAWMRRTPPVVARARDLRDPAYPLHAEVGAVGGDEVPATGHALISLARYWAARRRISRLSSHSFSALRSRTPH